MDCPDTDEIVELVDGEPSDEARAAMLAHLATCADCRALVAAMARSGGPAEAATPIGRYVVEDIVGRGGMGIVYRARDPALDRSVALKLVRRGKVTTDAEARVRLSREARALAQLSHPNVVTVYDVGDHEGGIYIAMELVAGETLREWLHSASRGGDAILDVLHDAGRGLAAAHAAGLVHRDVKPDNIVVGEDGRARVLDFGLVGVVATDAVSTDAMSVTRTGAVLGTPAFMAPEQLGGGVADARSDQFSYCATVCEALAGERPVPGQTADEILEALARGEIRVPPAVPPRLRTVLARGLARDPDQRFATMDALLDAIAAARRPPRWRRLAIGGGAAVAIVAGSVVAVGRLASTPDICGGADRALAGVWDAQLAAELAGTIDARAVRALDDYAAGWATMRTEACRAARVERTQSEAVMDQRMRCLDRRLAGVRGLVGELRRPDAKRADATSAVLALPALAACADLEAIARTTPLPEDPRRRADFLALEARIAAIDPLGALGRFDDAIAAATSAADEARELGHTAVEAQVRIMLGRARGGSGQLVEAAAAFREAVQLGARAGDDRSVAEGWIGLIAVTTHAQRFDEAVAMVEAAEAAVLRAGSPPDLAVLLDVEIAATLSWIPDYPTAVKRLDRARDLARASLPRLDRTLARVLVMRGDILNEIGRNEEAIEDLRAGRAIFEELYGAEHQTMTWPTGELGMALALAGRVAEGRAELERAVALSDRYGERGRQFGWTLKKFGDIAWEQNDHETALAAFRRSVEIHAAIGGADDRAAAVARGRVGSVLLDTGDHAGAEAAWQEVLAIRTRTLPPTDAEIGETHFHLGRVAAARGDRAAAIARFEAAIPILAAGPPDEALLELGRARARLAMLLWEDPRQRARARTLADEAEKTLVTAGSTKNLAQLRAWRSERGD